MKRPSPYLLALSLILGLLFFGQVGIAPSAHAASISDLTPHEARMHTLINQARADNGLAGFGVACGAVDVARTWSRTMARPGTFAHNPSYVAQLQASGSSNATAFAENIAYGYATADDIFNAYMGSPGHRANMLSATMRDVGIGSVRNANGTIYNTIDFINAETGLYGPPRVPGDVFGGRDTAAPLLTEMGVAAIRTTANSVLAFIRGTDGALWYRAADASGQFLNWVQVGGGLRFGPAAVSWDGVSVHVFVTGYDESLWQISSGLSPAGLPLGRSGWHSHGGGLTSGPGAASAVAGQLSVAARGRDGSKFQKTWTGVAWTGWDAIGGNLVTAPALQVLADGRYRLLAVGTDGYVWTRDLQWNGSTPTTSWGSSGRQSSSAVSVSATSWWSRTADALTVQRRDQGLTLTRPVGPSLVELGGAATSGSATVERGSAIWVFVRGSNGALFVCIIESGLPRWISLDGLIG